MSLPVNALRPRRSRLSKLKHKLAGLIRVTTYLTVVGVASGFLLARAASARIDEAVQRFGERLLRQLGPELIGQTQSVVLNGQRILFSSQVVDRSISSTLDELTRHCESMASPALAAVQTLPRAVREGVLAGVDNPARLGIARHDTDDHALGQIACIAHPQDGAGLEQAFERILSFLESGDLSDIGEARYFLARKLEQERTQLISIWTEGHFDLAGMFPGEGDAPGSDSPVIARPPGARRTFSALVPDRPYAVRMYESQETREAILKHYDELMATQGWTERPTSEGDELRVLTRAFSRDDTVAFVVLDAARDGETPVTLLELGGSGFAHAAAAEQY